MGDVTYLVTDGENHATTKDKETAYQYMHQLMNLGQKVEVTILKEDK